MQAERRQTLEGSGNTAAENENFLQPFKIKEDICLFLENLERTCEKNGL